MKILFLVRHYGYLRNYESVIIDLAARGHQVHIAADREEALGGKELVQRLVEREANVTYGWTPDREGDDWLWLATKFRLAQDYLRYLDPRYDEALQLRLRAEERTSFIVLGLIKAFGIRTGLGRAVVGRLLRFFEEAVPRDPEIDQFLTKQAPDLVLFTPLVDLGSPQQDHLKSAQSLGLKTVLLVGSWDHLSSKSLIRTAPDRITVWNETQKNEAVTLHGVSPDRVVVTGAQCYDQWFGRVPARSREEFCHRVGLPVDRRFILWVCSSLFRGSHSEVTLVEEWIQRLRSSGDQTLQDAAVLVRPHPARLGEWRRIDLSEYDHVTFHGTNPVDPVSQADYFDAMYYSAAVVGLNTSAMLEAGVIGRPVLTIVHPNYAKNQEGTLHWKYLVEAGGGLARLAHGFDEHLQQLAAALAEPATASDYNRRFVEAFIRPRGLDEPATPVLTDAIEELGRVPGVAVNRPLWGYVGLPLLYPLLWFRWLRSEIRLVRKHTRKWLKRALQNTKRTIRQAAKQLILKNVRTQQQGAVLPKSERARARAQNLFESVDEVVETKEAIDRLARSRRPLIVGPWLSETGFELLYWIPFLTWAKTNFNLRDDRLIVVSRGGSSSWYRHLTSQYRDVFEFYSPDEFRVRNDTRIAEQGGKQKHIALAEFDQEIVEHVKIATGFDNAEVLHPSLMYNLFRMFWRLRASVGLVQGYTLHRLMKPPPLGNLSAHVPREYVAVKFYANNGFPSTSKNRAFIATCLRKICEEHHVVLLNTGVRFDDHEDFPSDVRDRIHTVDHLMHPADNLDVQTRLIAAARTFVGTYGGFSYLAPLCGVNTLAFFSDVSGFRIDHLEIAKRVFAELGGGSFVPLDVRDLDVLRVGLGVGQADGSTVLGTPTPLP